MSCSPFDLRDYFFGELAESERRQVELHIRACSGCQEDLDRLRMTHSTLLSLRDEEVPQRIGFVSDKVFEPSTLRRAWLAFWGSSARLGFASAAVLSAALLVFTFYRTPAPASALPISDAARMQEFAARVDRAVAKAVAESETRQAQKAAELLAAAEQRYEQQRKTDKADMENVASEVEYLKKRYGLMVLASNEYGGAK